MNEVVMFASMPWLRMLWLLVIVASTTCVLSMTSRNLSAVALHSSSPRSFVRSAVSILHARHSAAHVTASPFCAKNIAFSFATSARLSSCMIWLRMLLPMSVLTKPSPFHVAMPLYLFISSLLCFPLPGLSAAARYFASISCAALTYAVGCCIATRRFAPTAAAL